MSKQYIEEIPIIRSIACLMVVLVHVTAQNYTGDGYANQISLYLNQFARLGTPIFAVISAFLLTNSLKRKKFSLQKFFKSRATKIVSPFIIWSFIYLGLKLYLDQDIFSSGKQIANYFLIGDAHYHLYFIVTIIQFYLIFPFFQFIKNKKTYIHLFIISIPINYLWINKLYPDSILIFEDFNYLLTHRSFILNWISYFFFGGILSVYFEEIKGFVIRYKSIVFLTAVSMVLIIFIDVYSGVTFNSTRTENLYNIPIVVIFLLLLATQWPNMSKLKQSFTLIGNYSMGIYLVHPLVLFFLKRELPSYFWDSQLLLITFTIVVAISTLIVKMISFIPFSTFIVPIPKKPKTLSKTKLKEAV
ncbi:acyltransferase [Allobacillus sp. GCM10007489]|uniref:acyltransferase n=1 Tax=unclassified Allobacillus TaxID=2628859 RepID=UPI001642AD95|nr:acyltransferase [Allobacillus sp. SKP2-8]